MAAVIFLMSSMGAGLRFTQWLDDQGSVSVACGALLTALLCVLYSWTSSGPRTCRAATAPSAAAAAPSRGWRWRPARSCSSRWPSGRVLAQRACAWPSPCSTGSSHPAAALLRSLRGAGRPRWTSTRQR
ncbi:unnamed protein product [Prorocentrum cordatum]|uniref:Dolichyl-diphosphooligosaccharide--protein glycosyltransferase subunit KCP2 n=1 Tax=Prorocentrum cordatum TaxID=2364126 RepID=A0ABN9XL01_9DINO|nr:unnamed protein product [Polarella glacialis]